MLDEDEQGGEGFPRLVELSPKTYNKLRKLYDEMIKPQVIATIDGAGR